MPQLVFLITLSSVHVGSQGKESLCSVGVETNTEEKHFTAEARSSPRSEYVSSRIVSLCGVVSRTPLSRSSAQKRRPTNSKVRYSDFQIRRSSSCRLSTANTRAQRLDTGAVEKKTLVIPAGLAIRCSLGSQGLPTARDLPTRLFWKPLACQLPLYLGVAAETRQRKETR
jgi:hypothetical protein